MRRASSTFSRASYKSRSSAVELVALLDAAPMSLASVLSSSFVLWSCTPRSRRAGSAADAAASLSERSFVSRAPRATSRASNVLRTASSESSRTSSPASTRSMSASSATMENFSAMWALQKSSTESTRRWRSTSSGRFFTFQSWAFDSRYSDSLGPTGPTLLALLSSIDTAGSDGTFTFSCDCNLGRARPRGKEKGWLLSVLTSFRLPTNV